MGLSRNVLKWRMRDFAANFCYVRTMEFNAEMPWCFLPFFQRSVPPHTPAPQLHDGFYALGQLDKQNQLSALQAEDGSYRKPCRGATLQGEAGNLSLGCGLQWSWRRTEGPQLHTAPGGDSVNRQGKPLSETWMQLLHRWPLGCSGTEVPSQSQHHLTSLWFLHRVRRSSTKKPKPCETAPCALSQGGKRPLQRVLNKPCCQPSFHLCCG
ncbi:uncharacterized protein LOC133263167 [Pezoporus flaviventris]|uniref:uncharacterized protein LOC133263167 n=1 Tax=Pezoporus flaviventris TaxID=889875 RepID=UPI002AB00356|nr:uncharacterized protein LOC133263167 [Pezoporus flaviventris]